VNITATGRVVNSGTWAIHGSAGIGGAGLFDIRPGGLLLMLDSGGAGVSTTFNNEGTVRVDGQQLALSGPVTQILGDVLSGGPGTSVPARR